MGGTNYLSCVETLKVVTPYKPITYLNAFKPLRQPDEEMIWTVIHYLDKMACIVRKVKIQ